MASPEAIGMSSNGNSVPSLQSTTNGHVQQRTLILSPPSLSSHPERLNEILAAHDRTATDIQMLDRLSLSLVSLPTATYDLILILTDADNTRSESQSLITKDVLSRMVHSLKSGGRLRTQDGKLASEDSVTQREAIFAGLMVENGDMVKPAYASTESVPLSFGGANKRKTAAENGTSTTATTSAVGTGAVSLNINGKRKNGPAAANGTPAGVGFVDFSDDFDTPPAVEDSDDELIDENTLLDDEDLRGPLVQRMHPPPQDLLSFF